MNKKYILLFVGIVILFIIFVLVMLYQQNQNTPKPTSLQNQNPVNLYRENQKINTIPTATLKPLAGSAKEAAYQFYRYYFSTPENPLAGGAYKMNPYLTQDFKNNIEAFYHNGNAPLFCPQNKRSDIAVGNEVQIYYDNQYLTQETINDAANIASTGAQELYRITLENNDGKWYVDDVTCVY